MAGLRVSDLRALLDVLESLYQVGDLAAFRRRVVTALPGIVPSTITTYNEVHLRGRRAVATEDPPGAISPALAAAFDRYLAEHPLIAHYRRTGDLRARRISDLLTRRQFHDLGLYQEVFRHLDVEHQIAVGLETRPGLVIGLALNRRAPDFSGRDRALLDLLRPHLVQAYRTARAVDEWREEVTLARQALAGTGHEWVCLGPAGGLRRATVRARTWLADAFGLRPGRADRLPEPLASWMRDRGEAWGRADRVPPPRTPLVVERGDRRLVVRLLPGGAAHPHLLLEAQRRGCEPAALAPLGLTPREAEVLAWVAQGKTDAEIGTILGCRPRTVQKHLEHIFQKLGVENRTAAAVLALGVGTPPEPAPLPGGGGASRSEEGTGSVAPGPARGAGAAGGAA